MITCSRTNAANEDFRQLVKELDKDLSIRDGEDHSFYAPFNTIDSIKHAVVAYDNDQPVGCGAIKEFTPDTMEVKRMYVPLNRRGQGIASVVLNNLEQWAFSLGYHRCILETGKKQPEAVALYLKNGYKIIPNYGQYENVENSVCFGKLLQQQQ